MEEETFFFFMYFSLFLMEIPAAADKKLLNVVADLNEVQGGLSTLKGNGGSWISVQRPLVCFQ